MDFLKVRPMTEADLPQVALIEAACFSDPWSQGTLKSTLKSQWDEVWVLEAGTGDTGTPAAAEENCAVLPEGTILGYGNFRFLAGEGELMRIAILPDFRGRGYSRKLMDRLVESARVQGVSDLTLEVRAGNEPAKNLYGSYGFIEEAVRKNYYQNPTEDALIMWRRGLLGITT